MRQKGQEDEETILIEQRDLIKRNWSGGKFDADDHYINI